jgi:hypothetical protein
MERNRLTMQGKRIQFRKWGPGKNGREWDSQQQKAAGLCCKNRHCAAFK